MCQVLLPEKTDRELQETAEKQFHQKTNWQNESCQNGEFKLHINVTI